MTITRSKIAGTEAKLDSWTGKASNAEDDKAERTREMIDHALKADSKLASYSFVTYPKGSYPNHTNVRNDSDVDIAVELGEFTNWGFERAAAGMSINDLGYGRYAGGYSHEEFKNDIEHALIKAFGAGAVTRGNTAITVRETSRSLAADVVPCVTYKLLQAPNAEPLQGIKIYKDSGGHCINWPKQHLAEGIAKNKRTSRRYKRAVRILKRLENAMVKQGVITEVPSFLIESLVWNAPDSYFASESWEQRVADVLSFAYHGTASDEACASWTEANAIKSLFGEGQKWDRTTARNFALSAWRYLEFE